MKKYFSKTFIDMLIYRLKQYFGKLLYRSGCRLLDHPNARQGELYCQGCGAETPHANLHLSKETLAVFEKLAFSEVTTHKIRALDCALEKTDKQLKNIYKERGVKNG